jgi:hypothetical protein
MNDLTDPSVYFAYFLFVSVAFGAVFFFIRSLKDGYLGKNSEDPKYRMLEAEPPTNGAQAPRRP